ncbi:MAG: hypothetical protein V4503_02225 [Gemmatimonadota bacterium]
MSDRQNSGGTTREMRMVSQLLGKHGPLERFLAVRRTPGDTWLSWEQIGYEIQERTGESFTREGIHRWALRFGIFGNTRKHDGPQLTTDYLNAIAAKGIDISALATTRN